MYFSPPIISQILPKTRSVLIVPIKARVNVISTHALQFSNHPHMLQHVILAKFLKVEKTETSIPIFQIIKLKLQKGKTEFTLSHCTAYCLPIESLGDDLFIIIQPIWQVPFCYLL